MIVRSLHSLEFTPVPHPRVHPGLSQFIDPFDLRVTESLTVDRELSSLSRLIAIGVPDMATSCYSSTLVSKRLEGKVAIITGGASGVGAAAVRLFESHGASVVIGDVQDDLGAALAKELSPRVKFFHCDVTQEHDVEGLVSFTMREFGGHLDIMYSNAGILGPTRESIQELDIDTMDRVYAVNVTGAVLCMKHAARLMIPAKQGVILATASASCMLGGVGPLQYTVSKNALVGLVKEAAYELAPHGIRVNCISPMGMPTPMSMQCFDGLNLAEEAITSMFTTRTSLRGTKILSAEDVAKAALFLASPDGHYISGHNLLIDGAFTVTKGHDSSNSVGPPATSEGQPDRASLNP